MYSRQLLFDTFLAGIRHRDCRVTRRPKQDAKKGKSLLHYKSISSEKQTKDCGP